MGNGYRRTGLRNEAGKSEYRTQGLDGTLIKRRQLRKENKWPKGKVKPGKSRSWPAGVTAIAKKHTKKVLSTFSFEGEVAAEKDATHPTQAQRLCALLAKPASRCRPLSAGAGAVAYKPLAYVSYAHVMPGGYHQPLLLAIAFVELPIQLLEI
jgi:hypothetical protein